MMHGWPAARPRVDRCRRAVRSHPSHVSSLPEILRADFDVNTQWN